MSAGQRFRRIRLRNSSSVLWQCQGIRARTGDLNNPLGGDGCCRLLLSTPTMWRWLKRSLVRSALPFAQARLVAIAVGGCTPPSLRVKPADDVADRTVAAASTSLGRRVVAW